MCEIFYDVIDVIFDCDERYMTQLQHIPHTVIFFGDCLFNKGSDKLKNQYLMQYDHKTGIQLKIA